MNFRFPVFLDLTGKNCLITGAGYEVPSKVQALVDASANVTYIHPSADPSIEGLAASGLIQWQQRDFQLSDLGDRFLVITDHDDNGEIFRTAEEQGVLCNSVDDPPHCRFSFGAVHRQGELTIAISTNGWAPAVAVRLKEWLQRDVGSEYAALLDLVKQIRPEITSRIGDFSARRALWYRIVDSDVLSLLRSGQNETARNLIRQMLEEAVSSTSPADTFSGEGRH